MRKPAIFRTFPFLQNDWIGLIEKETPVYQMENLGKLLNHQELYVKREDLTDIKTYGGNKVRNLEFLLGDAIAKNHVRATAVGPLGSNFIAALAAQSKKLGFDVEIYSFLARMNEQVEKHASYTQDQGAVIHKTPGPTYFAATLATIHEWIDQVSRRAYRMPTGGSNAIGALGHMGALFELIDQIRNKEIPEPDVIVVGAGTTGTIAGLLAGIALSDLKTRVIGIRCVDQIVCNRRRIAALAGKILKHVGVKRRLDYRGIDLRDIGGVAYASPIKEAAALNDLMIGLEGIPLDTTYTSKVVFALLKLLESGELDGQRVLYWHTFSPTAMLRKP